MGGWVKAGEKMKVGGWTKAGGKMEADSAGGRTRRGIKGLHTFPVLPFHNWTSGIPICRETSSRKGQPLARIDFLMTIIHEGN